LPPDNPPSGAAVESDPRKIYLETLNLRGTKKKKARETALQRAHEIRQFEIELYWKRANYFWLLQAAVFAAVGLTWRSDAGLPGYVPVALSSLGFLTALGGWLATQGSKFWQRNWEHHIDMLEGEFEGDLYKTVYISSSGVRWSLSGVSETLAMWFTAFWLLMFVATAAHANPSWDLVPSDLALPSGTELITLGLTAITFVGAIHLFRRKGRIKGKLTAYPADFSPGKPYVPIRSAAASEESPRGLMRREPKI
jgi:hypothetical protein